MNQIKSKKRVTDHGEVFTSNREVNTMLDLIKYETENIDSRFLEPACGSGVFLAEVLKRKLKVVEGRYKKNQLDYERYSLIAVSSIYGIELLKDNTQECRSILFNIFNDKYIALFKSKSKDELRNSIKFILQKNIICGNALNLQTVDENPKPIIFSEWSLITGSIIKRMDYYFKALSNDAKIDDLFPINKTLKSDMGQDAFIPCPIKTYPTTHFLRISDDET